jgi:hypothetical protein
VHSVCSWKLLFYHWSYLVFNMCTMPLWNIRCFWGINMHSMRSRVVF